MTDDTRDQDKPSYSLDSKAGGGEYRHSWRRDNAEGDNPPTSGESSSGAGGEAPPTPTFGGDPTDERNETMTDDRDSNWTVEALEDQQPVIRVVGLGGGGTNAVLHMAQQKLLGADFVCANTDVQHLAKAGDYANLIRLGPKDGRGLGAGAKPEVGREAAHMCADEIREQLEGSDMVFLAAGMGGGTGTGSAAVVAEIAREIGALTVAVVTKPFSFEGQRRMRVAEEGIKSLVSSVHSMITIPNDRLEEVYGQDMGMKEAFGRADHVLYGAVRGITDVAVKTGDINVDFEDIRSVMGIRGLAMMGSGSGSGEGRAAKAIEEALACPLLEEIQIEEAGGVLINVCYSDITLGEQRQISDAVKARAGEEALSVLGLCEDPDLGEELRVTVIMTGIRSPLTDAGLRVENLRKQQQEADRPMLNTARAAADELRRRRPSITRRDLD